MSALIDFIVANKVVILGAALAVSEALALIPGLQANGFLDGAIKLLKKLAGKE